jgi:hypothetical protein
MAATLICPKCGENVAVPPPALGNIRCAKCGSAIDIIDVTADQSNEPPASLSVGNGTAEPSVTKRFLRNPNSVQTAGLIWLTAGIGAVLYAIYVASKQTDATTDWDWLWARLILLAEVAAGAMFIVFGIQTRLGTASDVGGIAVVSLFCASFGIGVAYLNQVGIQAVAVVIGLVWSACLVIAAVLAASDRDEYMLWREQRADSNANSSHLALFWFVAICAVVAVIASIGDMVMPTIKTQQAPPGVGKRIP